MTLCFAAFIRVLKICAMPKVYNKTLCEAVIKSLDEYYGATVGSDDSWVSHLINCDYNLSPEDITKPMRTTSISILSTGMSKYVIPLLKPEMIPLAILTLLIMKTRTITPLLLQINGRLSKMMRNARTCCCLLTIACGADGAEISFL